MCDSSHVKHAGRFNTGESPLAQRVSLHGLLQTGHYQPEAVAKQERYYLPYLHVADCGTDIRLGLSLHSVLSAYRSLEEVDDVIQLFQDCNYMLSYCDLVGLSGSNDL